MPILRPHLIAGLLEFPAWKVFTGETHLQTEPPIDSSSLSCWRERLGEVGMKERLAQSIESAKLAKVIKPSIVQRVFVDTAVYGGGACLSNRFSALGMQS